MTADFVSETIDENGHLHIFQTDSEAEFIRHCFTEPLESRGGTIAAESLTDGWIKVIVTWPKEWPSDLPDGNPFSEVGCTLLGRRDWYDCRENSATADSLTEWWIVRHRSGMPYC